MTVTEPPLPAFRFEVLLDLDDGVDGLTGQLCDGAFAECEGLELSMEPVVLHPGGAHGRQVPLLGPVAPGQITLKRGTTRDTRLWTWFAGTRPGAVRTAHGQITLWTAAGTPALRFTITGCLPVRLRAPSLHAREGTVAIEELTLICAELTVADTGNAPDTRPAAPAAVSIPGGRT